MFKNHACLHVLLFSNSLEVFAGTTNIMEINFVLFWNVPNKAAIRLLFYGSCEWGKEIFMYLLNFFLNP